MVAIVSYKYLEIEDAHHGEYYGLIMLANCGMFFLATGTDLVTLFIGLELMALCFYILVGFLRADKRSNEAAMKYLLLGAFSSWIPALRLLGAVRHCGLDQARRDRRGHFRAPVMGSDGVPGAGPPPRWACCSRSRLCRSICGRRTLMRAHLRR